MKKTLILVPDADPMPVVLLCGNAWDGRADKPQGPVEILVKDRKIAEMGKKVTRPDGAKVIDLSQRIVTPGFIDCHVHMTIPPSNFSRMLTDSQARGFLHAFEPLGKMLMNGFTTVRDVGTSATWNYVTVDLRDAINQGMIAGPRMIVAPHIISSTGGHGDMSGTLSPELWAAMKSSNIADGPDEIQRVVRDEIKGGADWVKCAATGGFFSPTSDPGFSTYTQEELNILVKTAHDQGVPVCVHAYGDEAVKRALNAGVDSIEHGNMASVEALEMMAEKGICIIPTQYTFEDTLTNLDNAAYWAARPPWEFRKIVFYAPAIKTTIKNLAGSRVKIAFGTDAGMFPHEDNWKEFPTMVKNGISPLRALLSATSTAAGLLRRPDLGTLAVGKTADIIAMPGDPFLDINVTGRVDFVMKEGKIYRLP